MGGGRERIIVALSARETTGPQSHVSTIPGTGFKYRHFANHQRQPQSIVGIRTPLICSICSSGFESDSKAPQAGVRAIVDRIGMIICRSVKFHVCLSSRSWHDIGSTSGRAADATCSRTPENLQECPVQVVMLSGDESTRGRSCIDVSGLWPRVYVLLRKRGGCAGPCRFLHNGSKKTYFCERNDHKNSIVVSVSLPEI